MVGIGQHYYVNIVLEANPILAMVDWKSNERCWVVARNDKKTAEIRFRSRRLNTIRATRRLISAAKRYAKARGYAVEIVDSCMALRFYREGD